MGGAGAAVRGAAAVVGGGGGGARHTQQPAPSQAGARRLRRRRHRHTVFLAAGRGCGRQVAAGGGGPSGPSSGPACTPDTNLKPQAGASRAHPVIHTVDSTTMASRTKIVSAFLLIALAAYGAAPAEGLGSSRNVKALTDRQYTAAVR